MPRSEPSGLRPVLLVVDEEGLICRALARALRAVGDVIVAEAGEEALEQIERRPNLRGVVTDFNLGPGPNGIEVLREARRLHPGSFRFLHTASLTAEDLHHHMDDGLVSELLPKPMAISEVLARVREKVRDAGTGSGAPAQVHPRKHRIGDKHLLAKARDGDETAAEELLRRYRPLLHAIVVREQRVPSADVDDVLQIVYERFFSSLPRIRNPSVMLARIAKHACIAYFRKEQRERRALQRFALECSPHRPRAGAVEEVFLHRLDVQKVLRSMTRRCARLIRGVILRESTQREYAADAGVPLGSVASGVSRCLEKIRRALRAGGYRHHKECEGFEDAVN